MIDARIFIACGSLLLLHSVTLSSQSLPTETREKQLAELRREVESLNQGQKKIERDLSAVIGILTGKKPLLEDVFVSVAGSPTIGESDARVALVEFTDFQCPFCAAYARDTFGRIVKEYVDTGKVRYIIRNFPLEAAHPLARMAAELALCAQAQGKFWALHDRFFADQKQLASSDIREHAAAIGADPLMLRNCLDTRKYAAKIGIDLAEGRDLQVSGTPTFFIGYSDPADQSRIRAVRSIAGNVPYREFQKVIAEVLEVSQQGTAREK